MEASHPIISPVAIDLSREELTGRMYLSLNEEGKYSKREIVLEIVKKFVKDNPTATFSELQATFKRSYLGRFSQYEFLEANIQQARDWKELGEDHVHYFVDNVITSGDGVPFVVCVEWDRTNIVPVLGIAKALGWTIRVVK